MRDGTENRTVALLLNISEQEEKIRNQILETDRHIHELQMVYMRTQELLHAKMIHRNQVNVNK